MSRKSLTALSVSFVFTAFLAVGAMAQDASQIVASACSKCHPAKRVCANLGVKDKAAWDATVTRMIGKGAAVSEAEKPVVVQWLAGQQPGVKPLCE